MKQNRFVTPKSNQAPRSAGHNSQRSSLEPPARRFVVLVVVATTLLVGAVTAYTLWRFRSPEPSASQTLKTSTLEVKTVTALGRLEPGDGVIRLSAPASVEGSRVEQLLVNEGDWVRARQVIAILDNRERLLFALEEAKGQVSTTQARLAQVRAGAKTGEVNAQKAAIAGLRAERQGEITAQRAAIARLGAESWGEITAQKAAIARLKAESRNAEIEYQRFEALYQNGAISASSYDSKRLVVATTQQQINEAEANLYRVAASRQQQINEAEASLYQISVGRQEQLNEAEATLDQIAEVRPVDVQVAQAEVNRAIAAVKQAQANLNLAYVRTPKDSRILQIHTWPGEVVSDEGIADLGQTTQMYVVAEVYGSDISKVCLGQRVRVASSSLSGELQGTVERIGLEVLRQKVINTDPSADVDARVVEVRVRLNEASSQQVAALTNLQVKVTIAL